MEMQEMIDFELWLISMIRAICQREGVRLPSIARADELLDERLSLQHAVRLCAGARPPHVNFPTARVSRESPRLPASIKRVIAGGQIRG
jgi:hypothetical protein